MRQVVAILLCLFGLPVAAAAQGVSLQGQWDSSLPSDPTYTATILIDAQHRATFDSNHAKLGRAQSRGYAKVDGAKVEIILTNSADVMRIICTMLVRDHLECRAVLPDGRFSVPTTLKRVGPGPQSLMPASR